MGTWVDKPKKLLWGVLLSIGIPLILWLGLRPLIIN
jgi:hypothetical protein